MNLILFDSERNQKLIIIEFNYLLVFYHEVIQKITKVFSIDFIVIHNLWRHTDTAQTFEIFKNYNLGPNSGIDPNSRARGWWPFQVKNFSSTHFIYTSFIHTKNWNWAAVKDKIKNELSWKSTVLSKSVEYFKRGLSEELINGLV